MQKPKFSTEQNIKLTAITILINLYLKKAEFHQQFNQIVGVNHPAISYWTIGWINSHKTVMPPNEYNQVYEKLKHGLNNPVTAEDIDSCLLALDELAWRWNLKLPKPMAGFMLFFVACIKELKASGMTTVKIGPGFHPLSISAPLQLTIHDWCFSELGQVAILEQVNKFLKDYAEKLHDKGMSAFPRGLEQHAKWWFDHYVDGKPYLQIGEECYADPETIKRKVFNFRKLLHISLKK
jgi:hypothetical protein